MLRHWKIVFVVTFVFYPVASVSAQDKSVNPGINNNFRDPDPKEFISKFEVESREVFARRNEIVAACNVEPGQTVADIGAGTGLFTRLFADAAGESGRVIAVDISQNFLDHIQKTCREAGQQNVETLLCTADSAELPDASVDVAFICDTYHHFEFPLRTMSSLHRALKPGGRVILVDFRRVPGTSTDWIMNHVRAGQEVFESELVEAGFSKTREPAGLLNENYFVEFTKGPPPGLKSVEFPVIAGMGGVVRIENAVEKPQPGAKVVLDVTADAKPGDVNKGLERAARLLNLYGVESLSAADVRIVVVLHGGATKSALSDEFYGPRFGVDKNPNLPLIGQLRQAGVEVFVCGQALNYKGFPESTVVPDVSVAAAALTVIVNRQLNGYACVPVP